MPRPPRCHRICGVPQVDTFCPNGCENTEPILLTLDEYEVIRLVDLEQQTHERCAAQMDISRSTVQETATKLKVDDSTVSKHHKNARDKIRNAMEE